GGILGPGENRAEQGESKEAKVSHGGKRSRVPDEWTKAHDPASISRHFFSAAPLHLSRSVMPGLIVKPRSRIFHGHDWVYSTEVIKAFGVPTDGDEIALKSPNDQFLGTAIYNSRSHIVARRFSRGRQELDAFLFHKRIEAAVAYRRRHGVDERLCRVVWSESDGLPGVIVAREGDYVLMQTLSLPMDMRRALSAEVLRDLLQPKGIVERNDTNVRM